MSAAWRVRAGLADHEIAHFSKRTIPTPIIPLDLIEEIEERIDERGAVIAPLAETAARDSIRRLAAKGVEAIAITLLWSFRNPMHEQRLAELVREEAPNVFVTISSELVPILGEYERASTTSINSYLGPVIHRYIDGLEKSIRDYGYDGPISIMESGGGVLPAREAAFQAANLLTSGPAGGVLASQKLGERLGFKNIITSDMGGTSSDVGLIVDGEPGSSRIGSKSAASMCALPESSTRPLAPAAARSPVVDGGGLLAVGPRSAGAEPGPACFGRGGTEPT